MMLRKKIAPCLRRCMEAVVENPLMCCSLVNSVRYYRACCNRGWCISTWNLSATYTIRPVLICLVVTAQPFVAAWVPAFKQGSYFYYYPISCLLVVILPLLWGQSRLRRGKLSSDPGQCGWDFLWTKARCEECHLLGCGEVWVLEEPAIWRKVTPPSSE
jgi:hypothetical protein